MKINEIIGLEAVKNKILPTITIDNGIDSLKMALAIKDFVRQNVVIRL
jgi:hypothetical protein